MTTTLEGVSVHGRKTETSLISEDAERIGLSG
jgi:hypothetical protein